MEAVGVGKVPAYWIPSGYRHPQRATRATDAAPFWDLQPSHRETVAGLQLFAAMPTAGQCGWDEAIRIMREVGVKTTLARDAAMVAGGRNAMDTTRYAICM